MVKRNDLWSSLGLEEDIDQVMKDLVDKITDDIYGAINRVCDIAPEPTAIMIAAAATAIFRLASDAEESSTGETVPTSDGIMLAALIAARSSIDPVTHVEAARKDFLALIKGKRVQIK